MNQGTLFSDKRQPRPTGKLGAVLNRLLEATKNNPMTPLDLALYPGEFGTDCMRQLRHARQWIENNLPKRVFSKRVPGKTYSEYWVGKPAEVED